MLCFSTTCPWQPWLFERGGDLKKGFKWTYHFSRGPKDIHRHLEGRVDQQGRRTSAGKRRPRQRLGRPANVAEAIGRVLMSNPKLLFCDEISHGLAPLVIHDI